MEDGREDFELQLIIAGSELQSNGRFLRTFEPVSSRKWNVSVECWPRAAKIIKLTT